MLNEPALEGLIEEASDLHADAMREVPSNLVQLREHHLDVPASPLLLARVSAAEDANRLNRERT